MKQSPEGVNDSCLAALAAAAGLASSWQRWPDELREAQQLAAMYVDMLPREVDAKTVPWVFPQHEGTS